MDAVLDWRFVLLAAGINAVVEAIKRASKDMIGKRPWYSRALAILPVVLGAGFGVIPGVLGGTLPAASRILVGALAGSLSSSLYAMVKSRALKG